MSIKNAIAIKDLTAFEYFLLGRGFIKINKSKSPYEISRFRRDKDFLIVYSSNLIEYASIENKWFDLVEDFTKYMLRQKEQDEHTVSVKKQLKIVRDTCPDIWKHLVEGYCVSSVLGYEVTPCNGGCAPCWDRFAKEGDDE
jgi:hypothetical protein